MKTVSPGGAADVNPVPAPGDGGHDDIKIFAAEQAILPGVRIQASHRNARFRYAQRPTGRLRQMKRAQLVFHGRRVDGVPQRNVNGNRDHPQLVVGQHHGEVTGARARRRDLGVPRIIDPRRAHRFLVQRCGDDTGDAPRQRQIDGGNHPSIRRRARALIEPAERQVPGSATPAE